MIDLGERARQTFESVAEHPRRLAMSAMGVFWGAAAIVVMLAWGTGFRDYMGDEMGRYGRPSIFVIPGLTSSGFPGYRPGVPVRAGRREAQTAERASAEWVDAVIAEHWSEGRVLVEVDGRVRRLDLTATDQRFVHYRRFQLLTGRFFDTGDVERSRAVMVLGYEAAAELFDDPVSAVGRTLRVEGQPFELIGIFDPKSGRQYMNTNRPDNRLIVIPSSSAETRLGFDDRRASVLFVYPRAGADSQLAYRSVIGSLASSAHFHSEDPDAVRHFDLSEILGMLDAMHIGLTLFLGFAGSMTLLVGGLGIANHQLAILAEREVEIGVAKALGARNRRLAAQAALEAILVAGAAAVSGLALGVGGCLALEHLAPRGLFPVPVISLSAVAITTVALLGVAVLAALVPALRVRRMDVSIALRQEL